MSNEEKHNEEEVDLGSLFVIIGRGFSNFFAFVGNTFRRAFEFLIQILLFFRKNVIKIGIGGLIGGLIGSYYHFTNPDIYRSEMVVQPNFNSTKQLYSTIQYYNNLVQQRDTILLAKSLGIDINQASSITSFQIAPVKTNNDIVNSFDGLVRAVDTATIKNISFNDFKRGFTDYDYRNHIIGVTSLKNNVFGKLRKPILSSLTHNDLLKNKQALNNQTLHRSDSLLKSNLHQVDSLRKVYLKVLVNEAKKQNTGTSIDMGSTNNKKAKEIELFETSERLNFSLRALYVERSKTTNIVNVVSDFQSIGHKVKSLKNNPILRYSFLGVFSVVFLLLLMKLNNYLNTYKTAN